MFKLTSKSLINILILCAFMLWNYKCLGSGIFIKFGPSSLGNGGSNPISIPPSLADTELYYISNTGFEASLLISGILIGARLTQPPWGAYISIGGGLVLDVNGSGPGIYSAFGYDFGFETIKFNIEYKQALGITTHNIIAPYSLKLGVGIWFN